MAWPLALVARGPLLEGPTMCALTMTATAKAGPFIPAGITGARFAADQERFLALLQAEGLDARRYESAFVPYPFVVTAEQVDELRALQESICRAIVAVVTHHAED